MAISEDSLMEDIISSNENYRAAVDKWCFKATEDDFLRWDYDLQTL